MTDSTEIAGRPSPTGTDGPAPTPAAERPPRPSLRSENLAPVLVRQPAPFSIRLSQFLWIISFLLGGTAIVYFFVVRADQLPLIEDVIRGVDASRPELTYASAADIVYWVAFATLVGLLLVQIALLVSFMSRRPGTRWWQLATVVVQVVGYALLLELLGGGEHGENLRRLLTGQGGLALLALLTGSLRSAISWTIRQHDIRWGTVGSGTGPDL